MYNWPNVAARTAAVYDSLSATTPTATLSPQQQLLGRLRRYRAIGAWAGLIFCCIVVWLHWFWALLEFQQPAEDVDVAVDWPIMQNSSSRERAGAEQEDEGVGQQQEEEEKQKQQQRLKEKVAGLNRRTRKLT